MQARAEVSVFFFFFLSEASPGRLSGDQRVMCTETEAFRAIVSRLWCKNLQTHCQSLRQGICIQHQPQSCGKNACNKQALCSTHVASMLHAIQQLKMLLFITFNIATIVCDGGDTARRRKREKRISGFLSWQMAAGIKPLLVRPWTIHYREVDVLLCQPLGAIWMTIVDKGTG